MQLGYKIFNNGFYGFLMGDREGGGKQKRMCKWVRGGEVKELEMVRKRDDEKGYGLKNGEWWVERSEGKIVS